MNTKEQWEEDIQKRVNDIAYSHPKSGKEATENRNKILEIIRETREQAIKQERERIKDEIGHIFTCLCDIPEYTDKMALERLSKIWESL